MIIKNKEDKIKKQFPLSSQNILTRFILLIVSKKIEKVSFVIAVAAGKGGVGKSTVTVCLSLALKKLGFSVGILDADIYGPSLRIMLPETTRPAASSSEHYSVDPALCLGLPCMSMAFLASEASVIRAPKANALITQFLHQVNWGNLDFLFIDFPPGTGDIQLTLLQEAVVHAALLVTTPQKVATADVKKAAAMFEALHVPILGVVENMSYFKMDKQQECLYLFGKAGGRQLADQLGLPLLAEIPIDPFLSQCLDQGVSIFEGDHENCSARPVFEALAAQMPERMSALEEVHNRSLKEFELIWKDL